MSTLRVTLFGQMVIAHDQWLPDVKISPILQLLFAYLLLNYQQHFHSRSVLIDVCWGNYSEKQARSCLSTALWRLRRLLEPEGVAKGTYLLISPSGEVGFNWQSDFWLDVIAFESQVSHTLKKPIEVTRLEDIQKLEKALKLYSADLLEGLYDDWILSMRERLRQLYLKGLTYLMKYYKQQGFIEQSLECGQKILDYDPLRENIYREIMRLYWKSGRRALAVRQFQICQQRLAAELNISPMKETQTLYSQIIETASDDSPTSLNFSDDLTNLQQAMQQLQLAQQEFKDAQAKLQHALELVEQIMQQQV